MNKYINLLYFRTYFIHFIIYIIVVHNLLQQNTYILFSLTPCHKLKKEL